jgi:NTP pyrophosphatase (non-canonical NTP hydrolase)
MTTLSLGGLSERLWTIGKADPIANRRFRGRKSVIEGIHRKRQNLDTVMTRLLAEVSEVHERWSHIQSARSNIEADKLTSVVARAQIMYSALARTVANLDRLSVFGLNACDGDIQAAASLLTKLRMEVRASAVRAISDAQSTQKFAFSALRLTA